MKTFRLVCRGRELEVRKMFLTENLFDTHPDLFHRASYEVACGASEKAFDEFARALQGEEISVTSQNFADLKSLSEEFGFKGLDKALSEFAEAHPGLENEMSLRNDVAALMERVAAQERTIETLMMEVMSSKRASIDSVTAAVRALDARISILERQDAAKTNEVEVVHTDLAVLREKLDALEAKVATKSDLEPMRTEFDSLKSLVWTKSREFKFTGNNLDGIISGLTRECGGNVVSKGVVDVTARDCYDIIHIPRHVVAFNENRNSAYLSKGEAGGWVCLDFKARRVKPTHYSIRTSDVDKGGSHLKSWVVEGSLDGGSWTEVDKRENNADLNGKWVTKAFAVMNSGEFRYIRIRKTGQNHRGDEFMVITALEVFGTLMD